MSQAHVRNNTGCIEWYTPATVVEAARAVLGTIDLDPASCAEANAIVRATRFYSVNDDGLTKTWEGRVFMNPPYSSGMIGRFARKLVEHYRAAEISEAVALVNNATETDWWQALARPAVAVCFIKGRLRFWRSEGAEEGTPLQGQTVMYFGARPEAFKAVFGKLGKILGPLTVAISHETRGELFSKREGRPVSFGRPMTPAERQRRSRMMRRNRDCQQHALAQGA